MSAGSKRSFGQIAGLVGILTLFSKVAGLARDLFVASVFGLSAALDAYGIAYKLPGLLLILLGGVNGPFHSAVVSVVAQQDRKETGRTMESITTLVTIVLSGITALLWLGAPLIVSLVAGQADLEVQKLAIEQLRIMAPVALCAGWIGLGFGVLTAADRYALPSLSPILSSVAMMIVVGLGAERFGPQVLAWGVLIGAVLQWLIQVPLQWRLGLGSLRPRLEWQRPEVQKVLQIMGPATGNALLANVNVWTDLFFATRLGTGVVGAVTFANVLIQAPVGVLSNMLLLPAMPLYSRLAGAGDLDQLRQKVRQGVILVLLVILPLSAFAIALAEPLVRVLFERGNFDAQDTQLVAQLFAGAAGGMAFYLMRDLLVRVFYALGDGQTPLWISSWGIGVNLALDWLLVSLLGPVGITLASSGVSLFACLLLLSRLRKRLGGLGIKSTTAVLILGAFLTGAATWGVHSALGSTWTNTGVLFDLLRILGAVAMGLIVQTLWIGLLPIPEVQALIRPLVGRLRR